MYVSELIHLGLFILIVRQTTKGVLMIVQESGRHRVPVKLVGIHILIELLYALAVPMEDLGFYFVPSFTHLWIIPEMTEEIDFVELFRSGPCAALH